MCESGNGEYYVQQARVDGLERAARQKKNVTFWFRVFWRTFILEDRVSDYFEHLYHGKIPGESLLSWETDIHRTQL
jgi:hypothetical protein